MTDERRKEQEASASACAQARFDRGARSLTDDESALCTQISRFGSDGYPVRKLGREWTWDFLSLKAPTLYKTKREAVFAFETFHLILIRLSGLIAQREVFDRSTDEELEAIARNLSASLQLRLDVTTELRRRRSLSRSQRPAPQGSLLARLAGSS